MRFSWFALLLVACGAGATTPAGRLGEVNLKSELGEHAPNGTEPTKSHEMTQQVCISDESPRGVLLKVTWSTFQRENLSTSRSMRCTLRNRAKV